MMTQEKVVQTSLPSHLNNKYLWTVLTHTTEVQQLTDRTVSKKVSNPKHMVAHGVVNLPKRVGGAHLHSRSAGKAFTYEVSL